MIGTLEIDTSTNCLVVRIAVGTGDRLVDVDVAWPPGWSVAIRDGEIVLIDAAGQTARRLGDEVWVGEVPWTPTRPMLFRVQAASRYS